MNLIRNLFGLLICMLMLNIVLLSFTFVGDIKFDYDLINDEIAMEQLRRILLISYDISVNEDGMSFIYHNKDFSLNCINNKLILQPGTQIFLNNIDSVNFVARDGCYVLIYRKGDKEYEKVICPKEGIYINDFSDCDVLYDGDSDSED